MKRSRFLGFASLTAVLLLSCSGSVTPEGVGGGSGGSACPGLAVDCPADTLDYCLPGDVPVEACCYATADGRHVSIGLCPRPDASAPPLCFLNADCPASLATPCRSVHCDPTGKDTDPGSPVLGCYTLNECHDAGAD